MKKNDTTVTYKSKKIGLSPGFLDRQNAWSNLNKLKILHYQRLEIEHEMSETDDSDELRFLNAFWQENQFELQETWGFERNTHFHRFWTVPKCTCPKMDNEDNLGSKYSYMSGDCPVHGGF